jgi:ribosomal protein S20
MRRALVGKDAKAAAELLPKTFSIIDRSAKSGIIKMNTAARYKSKLQRTSESAVGVIGAATVRERSAPR